MPKGTTLLSGLTQKRRELEQAIETLDATIRLVQGKRTIGGKGKARGPMSEETKAKLRAAHARRMRQAQAQPKVKSKTQPRPKFRMPLKRHPPSEQTVEAEA